MTRRRRKNNRAEIKLTAEGWVFLVVLGFITLGAVLRNVNLLVVLAGMMYAPLLLNWRLAIRWLKSLKASRRMPVRLHAQDVSSVQWVCENQLAGMAAWNLVVNDRITRLTNDAAALELSTDQANGNEGWVTRFFGEILQRVVRRKPDPNCAEVKLGFVRVNAGQSEAASYRLFFARRGRYVVGPAALSSTFPFGLIVSRIHYPELETIYVAPEIGELHPAWERRVQSIAVGSDTIKRRRALEEDEFYALRPWRSGDSKKNIHWRTSAKYGQPIVKQHDQQNNRDFGLILDLYSSPGDEPLVAASRNELALSFVATAILQIGTAVQGQIAIGICGKESDVCQSRSRQAIINEVMKALAIAEPSVDPHVIDVFLEVSGLVSRGTPIYVVSSRPRPRTLDPQYFQIDDDMEPENARVAKQLRRALPMLRWLEVGSKEFESMFALADSEETQAGQLNRFSTRWSADARR